MESGGKGWVDPNSLLCPETLQRLLPSSTDQRLESREGLKELIRSFGSPSVGIESSPLPSYKVPTPVRAPENGRGNDSESNAFWERCFELVFDEAIHRAGEMLRLNRARRVQIEKRMESLSGLKGLTLDAAIQSRIGTPEYIALQKFVHELALFHLFQFLVWRNLGGECLKQEKLNLSFAIQKLMRRPKSSSPTTSLGEQKFLKQNIFSWFHPSPEVIDRLCLFFRQPNPGLSEQHSPQIVAEHLLSRINQLNEKADFDSFRFLWQLVSNRVDSAPLRVPLKGQAHISCANFGASVLAAKSSSIGDLASSVSFSVRSELELYVTEMLVQMEIGLPPVYHLEDLGVQDATAPGLFPRQQESTAPKAVTIFIEKTKGDFQGLFRCLETMADGGVVLAACQSYWPADTSHDSEKIRELVLRWGLVTEIIDLRQLSGGPPHMNLKCLFLLQRCSSREVRDSQRPRILRFRGHLKDKEMEKVYSSIIEAKTVSLSAGDLKLASLADLSNVRQEFLEAAATQQQLKSQPWISLTDPLFFEVTSLLRRSNTKAHLCGTVMKNLGKSRPERSLVLTEESGHLIASKGSLAPVEGGYLFLPDSQCRESPEFFKAQIMSTPAQFFYTIEKEEPSHKSKASQGRQTEQLLKMIPLVRLLPTGLSSVLENRCVGSPDQALAELPDVMSRFHSAGDRVSLYHWIISVDSQIDSLVLEANELVNHLHPGTKFKRFFLPEKILSPTPRLVLQLFQHLDQSPLLQHPLIHITKLRPSSDFRITDFQIEGSGGLCELKIYQGAELVVRFSGPALFLQAASESIKVGRTFREWSERVKLPTDLKLLNSQLSAVIECSEMKLKLAQSLLDSMDLVFCHLLGLTKSWTDDSALSAMKKFLAPGTVSPPVAINPKLSREVAFAPTRGLLQ